MLQTVERLGRPAAPGVAAGPIFLVDRAASRRQPSGDATREISDLRAAIAAAVASIRAVARRERGDAADILEFQAAMLEDDALAVTAVERIAAGIDAATAWSETIAVHVADYENAGDEYFRARVADLRDLHDEVLRHLSGEAATALPEGAVFAGEDVTPTRFLSVDWTKGGGIALFSGSPSSHVAMLARSRGVPMIVGLGAFDLAGHAHAIVDGDAGRIVLSPRDTDWSAYEAARRAFAVRQSEEQAVAARPATTRDGVPISVLINVAEPEELDALDPAICDGVGLVRTEFLFSRKAGLPDEDSQYAAYRQIAEWAAPKPVVLRTLDAGGDKPIDGLTVADESNPFLGMRGIRLSLRHPEAFRVQLRAMARAAVHGNVRIMLPMVTVPGEIDQAAVLLDAAVAELESEGIDCRRPPLGIMVEVPSVAIAPEHFSNVAFFSIGSNDLTQYVMAAARDNTAVAALNSVTNTAVLRLVAAVTAFGRQHDIPVSLCGDAGGDPTAILHLLKAGLCDLSVAPAQLALAKAAIAEVVV